jgi:cell filamentation protein
MFFDDELHYYLTEEDFYDDPFCDENGVLLNNLGISNTKDLNEAEKALSALQNTRLQEHISAFLGDFDLQHLQNIHHQLFMDVYPWAGQLRRVNTYKGECIFLRYNSIASLSDLLFSCLNNNFNHLINNKENMDLVCGFLARFFVVLNYIHPFREGNGRSQRFMLGQILFKLGYTIDWTTVSSDAMNQAVIAGWKEGNFKLTEKMIKLNIQGLEVS